jgi:type II secretory pathway component GspD/PulD (secretin)
MRGPVLALAALWSLLGAGGALAQDVTFAKKKLRSPTQETMWYRFRPGRQAVFDHLHPVLTRQGLQLDRDYFMDRDDRNCVLAVTGKPEAVALVLRAISFLDLERPQVKVSVQIAETLSIGDVQSGLNITWDRKTSERTFFRGFSMDNRPQAYLDSLLSPTVPFQGSTGEFGTVDAQGNIVSQKEYSRVGAVYMAIRAVSEVQTADILAQPSILVADGEVAQVTTGSSYPYQQVTFQGNSYIITSKPITIGVELKVTPWILGANKVKVQVFAKVENIVGFVEIAQGARNPFTDSRQISNTVILESGATLAIGGLFQHENAVVEKGVPLLSDIPLLGFLFKSYWETKKKKELLFFITPRIIQPGERPDEAGPS